MKKQKMIITLLVTLLLLLILMPNVDAALQSNGATGTKQTINNWIINIRKMEALGGGMGLTETIGSNLVPTTASNNLDVHMEKNTEYGAMAILSASSYGNPNKITSGGTTTGNKTGIVINLNSELVAAGQVTSASNYAGANLKYKNSYTINYVKKQADAISETQGWHGSTASVWIKYSTQSTSWSETGGRQYATLLRAYAGSIFSYYGEAGNPNMGGGNMDSYLTRSSSIYKTTIFSCCYGMRRRNLKK